MYVQGCTANATSTNHMVGTLTNPTTTGNTIIVFVGFYNNGNTRTISSVVDNAGDPAPTQDPITPYSGTPPAGGFSIAGYRFDNIIGKSGHAVTITMSDGSDNPSAIIMEFGGRATNSIDTSNVSTDSGYTVSHLGTNLVTTINGDDIVAFNLLPNAYSGETYTPGSGWTA